MLLLKKHGQLLDSNQIKQDFLFDQHVSFFTPCCIFQNRHRAYVMHNWFLRGENHFKLTID